MDDLVISETKHLNQGTSCPPKQDGILRLYSMKLCPFADRVRIILLLKKIKHEIVNIDLKRKPDWFLELNPQGKVPALDVGTKIIVESLDVCDYLDDIYPEPKLYPDDIKAKNRDKELMYIFNEIHSIFYTTLNNPSIPLSEAAEKLFHVLQEFEHELAIRGDYFGGKAPLMIDYVLYPWIPRAKVLELARNEKLPIPDENLPNIRAWCARMKKLDVLQNVVVSTERAYNIFKAYKSGDTIDYDSL